MCTDSGNHIRTSKPNLSSSLASLHQSWVFMVSKKHSGKVDQSTLASGGSEHAYVVTISWGNKMNFRLCVNKSGFFSDSRL